jgi:molybdopterin converting factor small subunit
MKRITVEYASYLLRKLTSREREELELEDGVDLRRLIELLGEKYGAELAGKFLSPSSGALRATVTIDELGVTDSSAVPADGSVVKLFPLMGGG